MPSSQTYLETRLQSATTQIIQNRGIRVTTLIAEIVELTMAAGVIQPTLSFLLPNPISGLI